jgi:hypothetical protein
VLNGGHASLCQRAGSHSALGGTHKSEEAGNARLGAHSGLNSPALSGTWKES